MEDKPIVQMVGRKVRLANPQSRTKVVLVHRVPENTTAVRPLIARPTFSTVPKTVPFRKETTSTEVLVNNAIPSTSNTAILEITSLGDELLNGSDTSSKEVVINGRTYSIQNIAGQQMFVDVQTQQKLVPVEQSGELTLVDVLDDTLSDADLAKGIEPDEFMDLGNSTTHVDVIRPSQAHIETSPPTVSADGSFSTSTRGFVRCDFCQATFSKRSNFYRHLRRAHETDSNLFRMKPQGVKGKCPDCDSRFFSRHELLLHLGHVHQHEVVLFNLTFMNKDAYNRWLDDVKVQYTTSYVAHNGGRKSQDGRTGRIYHCSHEFMSYKMRQAESVDRSELTMRSRRSVANKVPYCTAHLRVFTDERGILYVTGSPTHINHEIDPDNLSGARVNLPSSETLPGYRSIFKSCSDGLPSQTKATVTSLVNKAEELKLYLQHRPVSESVLIAIQRSLSGVFRAVCSYKCRAIVSESVLEDQSAQATLKWTKES